MINLAAFNKQIMNTFFCILVSTIFLQGCGGQRDEPFSPATIGSSSSHGAVVATEELKSSDDLPVTSVDEHGTLAKISDVDTFTTVWRNYTFSAQPTVDWVAGQVVLIDLGKKKACDRKLTFNKVSAFEESTNSVVVVVDYTDKDKQSSSTSSTSSRTSSSSSNSSSVCNDETLTQPYYFYYVKTRDQIIFDENVL